MLDRMNRMIIAALIMLALVPAAFLPAAEPEAGPRTPLVLSRPEAVEPPRGAIVIEAEHYTALNWGWEVTADPACGNGAYIHCKEGIANGPGQIQHRIFNFYDTHEGGEYTSLKWHFKAAATMYFFIYGRMYTTGTHCSNSVQVGIDGGGPSPENPRYRGVALSNHKEPFKWQWVAASTRNPVRVTAGEHFIEVFIHEDGVRLDQIMLTPFPVSGDRIYTPVVPVNGDTAFRAAAGPQVDLRFDLPSILIAPDTPPAANLSVRKWRPGPVSGLVQVMLRGAGPAGTDIPLDSFTVSLAEQEELAFFPISFKALDLAALPRRELLLEAELRAGDAVLAAYRMPLMRPLAWEACGPFPYFYNSQPGPLDGDKDDRGDKVWVPFRTECIDHFGVLDFGLQTSGNSLKAPELVTIYARTVVEVPETGDYLLKIQSDDQMLLWIDGRQVYRHDDEAPVTRSVKRLKLRIEKGEHRIRMRVNQRRFSDYGDGRWQASLRFRTVDDDLSNVTGKP